MLKIFLFFIYLLRITTKAETIKIPHGKPFDLPKQADWCKIKCKHTVCIGCDLIPPRQEMLDNIVEFRQFMVDKHNEFRQNLASGEDQKNNAANKYAPAAANMMVINYDMELEFIARCYARHFKGGHDKCRRTHDGLSSGQNVDSISAKDVNYYKNSTWNWYSEVADMTPTAIDCFPGPFKGIKNRMIGHFTQVVWGTTDSIGCARIHHPGILMQTNIICNYAQRTLKAAANLIPCGKVYIKGPACSKCPLNTTCNAKYPSLCGENLPVPTDKPFVGYAAFPGGSGTIMGNRVLIFTVCVLKFFY